MYYTLFLRNCPVKNAKKIEIFNCRDAFIPRASPWVFRQTLDNRIKEGFVITRNPKYPEQLSKIDLSPEIIDGIVFWTKNPTPMLPRLSELEAYNYYFQFTLNSYGHDVETHVPSKNDVIMPTFKTLSKQIGREKLVWRYDPIFINDTYSKAYHRKYFKVLASHLADYTETCTVSFLDYYGTNEAAIKRLNIQNMNTREQRELMADFAEIANTYGLSLNTCAENMDLSEFGIGHAQCINKTRLERIIGSELKVNKDPGQRFTCGCVQSIDIGAYDGCQNKCAYCYAQKKGVIGTHDPTSPVIIGQINPGDQISERKMFSLKKKVRKNEK